MIAAPLQTGSGEAAESSNIFVQTFYFFADPASWTGDQGILWRTVEHLQYTGITLLAAALVAVPIGLYVGHTGRGRVAVVAVAGALRALPTLGLLVLFAVLMGIGLVPPLLALVILAIPPLLAGTYAGIASVNPDTVDAARSMGMKESQVLFRVEVPNGLTVVVGGFRTAVLQIIATVAVVAYLNLGGLGRYLIDGVAVRDYVQMFAGALLIAALAIVVDGVLAAVQRSIIPRGLKPVSPADIGKSGSGATAAGTQGGNS
ncbi:ABC transporter permease [Arthrobacter monumenti]